MGKSADSNNTQGRRVKAIRKQLGLTQEQLAEKLEVTPNYLSMIETGKKPLSIRIAKKLASLTWTEGTKENPPDCVRPAWIMGEDDFKTHSDEINAICDRGFQRAKILHSVISAIADDKGYSLKHFHKESAPDGMILLRDCYAVVENGLVIALIPMDDYFNLRNEIAHYSAYLVNGLLERQKGQCIIPFEMPDGK